MKMRLDFVSNSSSSSYTVPGNKKGCGSAIFTDRVPLYEPERYAYRDLKMLDKDEIVSGLRWYRWDKDDGSRQDSVRAEVILCEDGEPARKNILFFAIPDKSDEFVSWLMGMSLTHGIATLVNTSTEFLVALVESRDGTTNIDDEVIEEFLARIGKKGEQK